MKENEMSEFKPAVILLVEDDLGDQKLIKQSFQSERIANELKITDSTEQAIQYLERSKVGHDQCPMPDLILLDLNMPGVGGKELLKVVKADPELGIIPVVILTTSDSEGDIIDSFKLQAAGYVKKPVTLEEFQKVMTDLTDYWFIICKHIRHSKGRKNDHNFCVVN
jgi:CheY-like chemotaxis protein